RHLFPKPRRSFGTFAPLRPGELVGLDIKSFGSLERGGGRRASMHRGHATVGWRHLHVAIDMASRLVFTELRGGLGGVDAAAFLERTLGFFADRALHSLVQHTASAPCTRGSRARGLVRPLACDSSLWRPHLGLRVLAKA